MKLINYRKHFKLIKVLKDVSYDATVASKKDTTPAPDVVIGGDNNKEYGEWDLRFSTEGTYSDFLSFLNDLESNLRIVDISSIAFSSDTSSSVVLGKPKPADSYRYSFNIKTYWMIN